MEIILRLPKNYCQEEIAVELEGMYFHFNSFDMYYINILFAAICLLFLFVEISFYFTAEERQNKIGMIQVNLDIAFVIKYHTEIWLHVIMKM